jgi:hypothetical protein
VVFSWNGFQLKEMIAIVPEAVSQHIPSAKEPFDDEMEISVREESCVNWLVHFGLLSKKGQQISRSPVSGHRKGTHR